MATIAKAIYPTNAAAASYLNRKLKETDGRSFNEKDAIKAIQVLTDLAKDIKGLTIK